MTEFLKPQSLIPVTHSFQKDDISSSFQNGSTNWGPSFQTHEPLEIILIQAIIPVILKNLPLSLLLPYYGLFAQVFQWRLHSQGM